MKVRGYNVTGEAHRSSRTVVHRATRKQDGLAVVLKTVNDTRSLSEDLANLQREHRILASLDIPGVVRALGLDRWEGRLVLVEEDPGFGTLAGARAAGATMPVPVLFRFARAMAAILIPLHERVVHKDINPTNILWDPRTEDVRLIDFGIASEISEGGASGDFEGTLPYMSPEQTGRMNRPVDQRADFYSLGVTLYELATGELPFTADEPTRWVHQHITRLPAPPEQRNPALPRGLSALILKLLAKSPEDRYQSAAGLLRDLEACERAAKDEVPALGLGDVDARFRLPDRVVGRDREVQSLLDAFADASEGRARLVLVGGEAGIGKSALVREAHRAIVRQQGYLAEGKFEQLQRHVPYGAFARALTGLVGQLLAEPAERLARTRAALLEALGPNGQIVLHLVPEMERVIGPQPPVVARSSTEEQNRVTTTLCAVVRVLARPEHPLVLFLDDLQWSDAATLSLVKSLFVTRDIESLLLVGAYRDGELDDAHPFRLWLAEAKKAIPIVELSLAPLDLDAVTGFVADALSAPRAEVAPLAAVLHERTRGNPFFVGELLRSLHREGLLAFRHEAGAWRWDAARIAELKVDDNLAELVVARLSRLSAEARSLLQIAACIGGRFDLRTLAHVRGASPTAVAQSLWEAVHEGVVLPLDGGYRLARAQDDDGAGDFGARLQFQHDRVQQAAYALVPEAERRALHLRVGRAMLAQAGAAEREERAPEITRQVNEALDLVDAPAERIAFARLNLVAAERARASAAFRSAFEHLGAAMRLLPQDAFRAHPELAYETHKAYSAAGYLCGAFDLANRTSAILLREARTDFARAEVRAMQLAQFTFSNRMTEAIQAGIAGLELLGVRLPEHPSMATVLSELAAARVSLGGRSVPALFDLPPVTDPEVRLASRILADLMSSAYLTGAETLFATVVLKHVTLTLRHGDSPESAAAYASSAVLLAGLGDLGRARELGELAVRLVEERDLHAWKCRVYVLHGLFGQSWSEPWSALAATFRRSIDAGLVSGDFLFMSYACCFLHLFDPQVDLPTAIAEHEKLYPLVDRSNYQNARDAARLVLQRWRALAGQTPSPEALGDASFDERACLARMTEARYFSGVAIYHLYRMQLACLHGDDERAAEELEGADAHATALAGSPYLVELTVYAFLVSASIARKGGRRGLAARVRMRRCQFQMKRWAAHCPASFRHHARMMEAEIARLGGRAAEAQRLYREAITAVDDIGYLQYQAVYRERFARHFLEQGLDDVAALYLREAHESYQRWGARALVTALEARHPALRAAPAPLPSSSATTKTTGKRALDLDAIVKATQALSVEVVLERLLTRLMALVTENAGASSAVLLLHEAGSESLVVQASLTASGLRVLGGQPLEECPDVPVSVIRYVARRRESVVLGDSTRQSDFARDPYLQSRGPRSILVTPVIVQGRLLGVLYLENALVTDAFTPERIEVLHILSAHAAISIHNARLYTDLGDATARLHHTNEQLEHYSRTLEERVAERTRQLHDKNAELRHKNDDLAAALEQLRATQGHLIVQEKLASLGALTAGIAHELRNPLNFVSNFAEVSVDLVGELGDRLAPTRRALAAEDAAEVDDALSTLAENMEKIREHGRRAAEIISSMMLHARQTPSAVEPADLNALVAESVKLARHAARSRMADLDVRIEAEYGPDVGRVDMLAPDVSRVFINIINNAFHAMEQKRRASPGAGPGVLSIRTRGDADRVEVRIRDNGTGIPEAVARRIWEPFFTTKPQGEGTGLGLSICRDIVVQMHGGDISVDSTPGEHTEIIVSLPRRASHPQPLRPFSRSPGEGELA